MPLTEKEDENLVPSPRVVSGGCSMQRGRAAEEIRAIARSPKLTIAYKRHAIERMAERDIIIGDILHVLKYGFIHMDPTPATRAGFMKYAMESTCPNGGSRVVRVIVVPQKSAHFLKIVSVMWADEIGARAGSFVGEENDNPPLR